MDDVERGLIEKAKKIRPHASFFDWPDKVTKELGVVRALIETVGDVLDFRAVRPGADPPDAVGERNNGTFEAIEVTELVDEAVTGRNVRSMRETVGQDPIERMKGLVQREWNEAGLVAAVEERLKAKDGVTLKGGPFEKYMVVLHTDEPLLMHADVERWLRDHTFAGMLQVTDAYLLFSYDGEGYPYIRLHMAA